LRRGGDLLLGGRRSGSVNCGLLVKKGGFEVTRNNITEKRKSGGKSRRKTPCSTYYTGAKKEIKYWTIMVRKARQKHGTGEAGRE